VSAILGRGYRTVRRNRVDDHAPEVGDPVWCAIECHHRVSQSTLETGVPIDSRVTSDAVKPTDRHLKRRLTVDPPLPRTNTSAVISNESRCPSRHCRATS